MNSISYYIIGAGGLAKEVSFLAEEVLPENHHFMGFIDRGSEQSELKFRGKIHRIHEEDDFLESTVPGEGVQLYIGIGDPQKIKEITRKFGNFNFPNLISRDFKGDTASLDLGRGNIISTGSTFTVDICLGSFNFFYMNSTIAHDVVIGDWNMFSPGCNISGNVQIGSGNFFGTNCTVLQSVQIGNNNVIGAATLANKNVGDESTVVGVPAKKIRG